MGEEALGEVLDTSAGNSVAALARKGRSQEVVGDRFLGGNASGLLRGRFKYDEFFLKMLVQFENGSNVSTSRWGETGVRGAKPRGEGGTRHAEVLTYSNSLAQTIQSGRSR